MKHENKIIMDVFEAAYLSVKLLKPVLNKRGVYEITANDLAMEALRMFKQPNATVVVHDYIRALKKLFNESAEGDRKKASKSV
jgi:hypothetical protein